MRDGKLWINESGMFFWRHGPADMTADGVARLVDFYAQVPTARAICFCINYQQPLFDSRAWPAPNVPPADPAVAATQQWSRDTGLRNVRLLAQRGVDAPAIWLERCRRHGIEGWLSVRMNDCHYNDDLASAHHSRFWLEHRDCWRAPYRNEGWFESALDYEQPAVREHHLRLIDELLTRYVPDGIELDWIRFGRHFRPGREQAGRLVLTELLQQVRAMALDASRRAGRPVRIGVRVPARVEACLGLGYDVLAWSRLGLVDDYVLSQFLVASDMDCPVDIWRHVAGPAARLIVMAEHAVQPYPGGPLVVDEAFRYASAATSLLRGADGVYSFNDCDHENSNDPWVLEVLSNMADQARLATLTRRHIVSYPQMNGSGESSHTILPKPLRRPRHRDFWRNDDFITLRLPCGPRPSRGQAHLHLGLGAGVEPASAIEQVWLNGRPLKQAASAHAQPAPLASNRVSVMGASVKDKTSLGSFLTYDAPLDALLDDVNIVEIRQAQQDGELTWAEIQISPE